MTKMDDLVRKTDQMVERFQNQIRNQVASINRIMAGGTYYDEMSMLQTELAASQQLAAHLQQHLEKRSASAGPLVPLAGCRHCTEGLKAHD